MQDTVYDPSQLENKIVMFYHCKQCIAEKPAGKSPQEWGMNEVGASKIGVQVWCRRHDCNVVHFDFAGQRHQAYLERQPKQGEPKREVTAEQKEAIEDQDKDRRCVRILDIFRGLMQQAPEELEEVLPVLVSDVVNRYVEKDQEAVMKEFMDVVKHAVALGNQLEKEDKDD